MATRASKIRSLLFVVYCLSTLVRGQGDSGKCRFPKNVYTKYDWMVHDNAYFFKGATDLLQRERVSFKGNTIVVKQMTSVEGQEKVKNSVQLVCQKALEDNKYVVLRDDTEKFLCVEFVDRDLNVVQWNISHESTKADDVCSEELKLWDSPVVYYHDNGFWVEPRNEQAERKVCPLEGGFIASWSTSNRNEMMCDGAVPPLKVENECIIGEGMWIHEVEKNNKCPMIEGILYYRLQQKHICLAHWKHEGYEFMILSMYLYEPHVICARVPIERGDVFDMYVFPDGTCYSTTNIPNVKYIRIRLQRHVVQGECGDESPACATKLDTCSKMSTSRNCRETCGICVDGERYEPKPFPDIYQGKWLRPMFNGEVETWEVKGSKLISSSMGSFVNLGETLCSKGEVSRAADGLGDSALEYLLFSSFDNGCSPRFTSLSLVNRSEAVLSYKISDSRPGLINTAYSTTKNIYVLDKDLGWNCVQNEYVTDNPPLVDKYRKARMNWFNLVTVDRHPHVVDCEFRMDAITLVFNNISCQGWFQSKGFGVFQITGFDRTTCTGSGTWPKDVPTTQEFQCLARFQGHWGRDYLFTYTPGRKNVINSSHVCWITSLNAGVLFWHPAGDCDSSTELYYNTKRYSPLATIKGEIFTSSCVQARPITLYYLLLSVFLYISKCTNAS